VETDPDNSANHVLHLVQRRCRNAPQSPRDDLRQRAQHRRRQNLPGVLPSQVARGQQPLDIRLYFQSRSEDNRSAYAHPTWDAGRAQFHAHRQRGPDVWRLRPPSPPVPQPNQAVTVNASASDPAGVQAVTLWVVGSGRGWQQASMSPGSTAESVRL
jgi:hypothetical protein